MAFERPAGQRAGRHFYPGIYGVQIVRPYGLRGSARAKVFEVDLPAVWAQKKHRLQKHPGRLPAHVTLLPIDFATENLEAVFTSTAFDPASPAVSVRESVRPYLSLALGCRTLARIDIAAPAFISVLRAQTRRWTGWQHRGPLALWPASRRGERRASSELHHPVGTHTGGVRDRA
jgi:O-methyltransferase involved in polyketide biosynthesis